MSIAPGPAIRAKAWKAGSRSSLRCEIEHWAATAPAWTAFHTVLRGSAIDAAQILRRGSAIAGASTSESTSPGNSDHPASVVAVILRTVMASGGVARDRGYRSGVNAASLLCRELSPMRQCRRTGVKPAQAISIMRRAVTAFSCMDRLQSVGVVRWRAESFS